MISLSWYSCSSKNNNYGAPIDYKHPDAPHFWEFIKFIIDDEISRMDMHWRPASYICSLCDMKYDYIIKFENLKEESMAFLKQTKLDKFLPNEKLDRQMNVHKSAEHMSRYCFISSHRMFTLLTLLSKDLNFCFMYLFQFRNNIKIFWPIASWRYYQTILCLWRWL